VSEREPSGAGYLGTAVCFCEERGWGQGDQGAVHDARKSGWDELGTHMGAGDGNNEEGRPHVVKAYCMYTISPRHKRYRSTIAARCRRESALSVKRYESFYTIS
jgi:hypothetical protein